MCIRDSLFSYLVHQQSEDYIPIYLLILYISSCVLIILYLIHNYFFSIHKNSITLPKGFHIIIMIGASIAFVLSTYYFAHAFQSAPNPAYVTSISNTNAIFVLLLSFVFVFFANQKYSIHWQSALGVIMTCIGLSLIVNHS